MKETHSFASLPCNTAFRDFATSLVRFDRATKIARSFQEYRITKVTYMWKPLLDTYAQGGAPLPYAYILVDKTAASGGINSQPEFEAAGCKPIRLDDKTLTRSFKPSVLQYSFDASTTTNVYSKPIISPWLSCNAHNLNATEPPDWQPSSIDHFGLEWLVVGDPKVLYQVDMVAHFEFRKPAYELDNAGAPIVDVESYSMPITPPEGV